MTHQIYRALIIACAVALPVVAAVLILVVNFLGHVLPLGFLYGMQALVAVHSGAFFLCIGYLWKYPAQSFQGGWIITLSLGFMLFFLMFLLPVFIHYVVRKDAHANYALERPNEN